MEHIKQIQRAVDFIEENLNHEIAVDDIARTAGFSRWHFQIVFSAAVGDTLKEYIRKRRLTAALLALGNSELRMLDIALEAGFESQESFTRAFKAMFHLTPGDCRKNGISSVRYLNKPKITFEYLDHLYGGINMKPVYKKLGEKKIVGCGSKFISILSHEKNNHIVIPKLWGEFMKHRNETKFVTGREDLGICCGVEEVEGKNSKSHPDECFYIAGTEVSETSEVPKGMMVKIIPAGEYAVFTHRGPLSKLDYTMKYIYGSWLPKSERKLRAAPDLEVYDQRFKPDSEDSEFDLYIPVQ